MPAAASVIYTCVHKHSHFRRHGQEKWHLLPFTRCVPAFASKNYSRNETRSCFCFFFSLLFSFSLSRNKSPFVVINYAAKRESETPMSIPWISLTWSRINYDKTRSYFFSSSFFFFFSWARVASYASWDTLDRAK